MPKLKLLSDQVNEQEVALILRELNKLLASSTPGDVVEFGCYVGTTSVFLAEALQNADKHLWLYDSFAGLPEKTNEDMSPAGSQFRTGELSASRKQLEHNLRRFDRSTFSIKKAWFSDLTEKDIPDKISLAFLDGDYYDSILRPLNLIWNHMAPGGVVLIDDYDNEALPGAARAAHEWADSHGLTLHHEHGLAIFRAPKI
jgi:O-methyltransferase